MLNAPMNSSDADWACDLVSLCPGAIEGGVEQIIIGLLPSIASRPEVAAWSYECSPGNVPGVHLLLELRTDGLQAIVEACEDMLASGLKDEPQLAMRPLVEMPDRHGAQEVPWGVTHRRIAIPGSPEGRGRHWALEQALAELALLVMVKIREDQWDRKTIAPSLLQDVLCATFASDKVGPRAFQIMQALLTPEPGGEALIRRFRENSHRLARGAVPILADDASMQSIRAETRDAITAIGTAARLTGQTEEPGFQTELWRRLANKLGFSSIEAAYIACLTSTAAKGSR